MPASETDVDLCGGGQFAEWLLYDGLIHHLKLQLNPKVRGEGVQLLENSKTSSVGKLIEKKRLLMDFNY